MSFVEPLFLLGLLAAGLPIAIHLINRRKAVQQPFPALQLLRESDKKEARSVKVRQWVLMALRVLAVVLLAMALAKPYVFSQSGTGSGERLPKSVVFVLDDSMSMHNGQWWEEATGAIEERLGQMKPWDEVALLTSSKRDGPVGRLENDHGRVRRALDELAPSQATAQLPDTLMAASDLLETSDLPNQRIVVVSDFTRGGFPSSGGADQTVGYPVDEISVREADQTENLAVTGVDYEQVGPAREGRWRIAATVRNYGSEDADRVEVRLTIGEQPVGTSLVDVPAGKSTTHTIEHTEKGTGVRRGMVELVDADELSVDNRRYFTFRMKKNVRALLVNGAPSSVPYRDELFFTVRALNPGPQSDSSIVPDVITPEGLGPKDLADYDVVLMANVARISERVARKLEGFVEEGGGLYLALGDQVETDNYNQQLGQLLPKPLRRIKRLAERNDPDAPVKITRIGSSRREHPVFRAFDMPGGTSLQSVGVYKYMLLNPSPPEQSTVLLSYKDGTPALLERRVDKGRVFLLTTTLDRAWTDLPVRSAFLPMIRRSILYLARRATSEGDAAHTVGEPVTIDASGLVDERAVLRGPDEIRHVIEPQKGEISFTPERAGGWEVWTGEGEGAENRLDDLAFSVNVPTVESDLGGLPDGALAAWTKSDAETDGGQSGGGAEANKKRVNVWPALLFAVTLALLLETIIGTRRSVLKKLGRRLTFQKDPEIDV